jgi:hypothetical protein
VFDQLPVGTLRQQLDAAVASKLERVMA